MGDGKTGYESMKRSRDSMHFIIGLLFIFGVFLFILGIYQLFQSIYFLTFEIFK